MTPPAGPASGGAAPPAAVTFDFWNTLVVDGGGRLGHNRRLDAWLGILEDAGFATEREQLEKAMAESWQTFLAHWQAGEQYTHTEAAIEIVERLGYKVPPDVHDGLLRTYSYGEEKPSLTPNIEQCLRTLRGAGVRIGIICDVGMTPSVELRGILEHFGVLELFDHWSFSDEVGHYKPSPLIFDHALAGLGGIAADRAAHVGDLRRTDVAGALGYGMTAVRYTGCFDDAEFDGPDTDLVIADHADLPAALGL
jgi:putative hydrolase of the HAD superfamily